ncbi:MAG TPA: hypothetical protein V6C57_21580 [Coleofasciculaceae cyanobacterium]
MAINKNSLENWISADGQIRCIKKINGLRTAIAASIHMIQWNFAAC